MSERLQQLEAMKGLRWESKTFEVWLSFMGMSHKIAAEALGYSAKTISRMAKGQTGIDRVTILACQYLAMQKWRLMEAARERVAEMAEQESEVIIEELVDKMAGGVV